MRALDEMNPFAVIDRLRSASVLERAELLEKTYRNNMELFRKSYPALLEFIDRTTCPYHFEMTDSFLQIVHTPSGRIAHPEAGLDYFAEMMGDWVHEAWVDLFNFKVAIGEQYPLHHKVVHGFQKRLDKLFPDYSSRLAGGRINLKETGEGKRFSPPTVFLGIFHGLHIAYYLERTELSSALFIEPEPERFEVSCYFLDYSEIERLFGTLHISIGSSPSTAAIESFFSLIRITPQVWIRVLPGYQSSLTPVFVEYLKSLNATMADLVYPVDHELTGLRHGVENLEKGYPLLSRQPCVSKECRIVVVATGPSLINDLEWLKTNQHRLIIFAVHSSVRVLRQHGIIPDFQFNLDAVIPPDGWFDLKMYEEVPLISDYRIPPYIVEVFSTPLLCSDRQKQGAISFVRGLTDTHPSTTNLAVSFACYCRPSLIYLCGCDFGYRDMEQDHARGAFYDRADLKKRKLEEKKRAAQTLHEPNFPDTPPVLTIPVHLRTKMVLERCLAVNGQGIDVVNCSDGVRVVGARPQRSESISLEDYPHKRADASLIVEAFAPANKGKNWFPFEQTGSSRLDALKDELLQNFSSPVFDWRDFSLALDNVLTTIIVDKRGTLEQDTRMDTYCRVLADLLKVWYQYIILFDEKKDAEAVYHNGRSCLEKSLDELHWPVDFDL